MSLFFVNERRPKVVAQDLVPNWDEALRLVSLKVPSSTVSVMAQLTMEQARDLRQTCKRIEPLLIAAIQDGTVTTQSSAVDFIRANTNGFFPAARFIGRWKEIVGTEASPATWVQVVADAQTEQV